MSTMVEQKTPKEITDCIKNQVVDMVTKIVTIRSHLDKVSGYIVPEDLEMIRNLEIDIGHMKKEVFDLDTVLSEERDNQ